MESDSMRASMLINQLRAPDQRGMGRIETVESGAANIDRLAALDEAAATIRVWDSSIIPGNLQLPAYSAAVIHAAHPKLPHYEVRRRVLLKDMKARTFLSRTFDPELRTASFVIGERAIITCMNLEDRGEIHAAQLRHLLTLSASDKVSIQVLPGTVVPPGLADQFALYSLDAEHRVGYIETIMGAWYSSRLDDVAKLFSTYSDIEKEAMSPESTRQFLREVLTSWRSKKKMSPAPTEERGSSSPPTPGPIASGYLDRARIAQEPQDHTRAPWRMEP